MEAILVIESRGLAPQVRSAAFNDIWSRLYQAEGYVLDLSCQAEGNLSKLQGQVMVAANLDAPTGEITLLSAGGEASSAPLDSFGQFQLNVREPGDYSLQVDTAEHSFAVSKLSLK